MDRDMINRLMGGKIKVHFLAISLILCDQHASLVEEERSLEKIGVFGCYNDYHRWGAGAYTTEIYISQFWMLQSVPTGSESSPPGSQTCILLCSYMREIKNKPSPVSSYKGTKHS